MPNKYAEKKEWNVPKQRYKLSNWSEYSDGLRRRGEIDVWLSEEAISLWGPCGRTTKSVNSKLDLVRKNGGLD